MFLHLCVILFTGGLPTPPPRCRPPKMQTPLDCRLPHPGSSGCRPPPRMGRPPPPGIGQTPPWMQTPPKPGVGKTNLWMQIPPRCRPPGVGQTPRGLGRPPWMQTPPRYSQLAGGKHPTGMYTCYWKFCVYVKQIRSGKSQFMLENLNFKKVEYLRSITVVFIGVFSFSFTGGIPFDSKGWISDSLCALSKSSPGFPSADSRGTIPLFVYLNGPGFFPYLILGGPRGSKTSFVKSLRYMVSRSSGRTALEKYGTYLKMTTDGHN